MRQSAKIMLMGMVVLLCVTSFASPAFSGVGGPEQLPGSPPNGVQLDKQVPGVKLDGSLFIMYYGIYDGGDGHFYGSVNIVLNLRNGKAFKTLFATADNVVVDDPAFIQATLTNLMKGQISMAFFGNKPITIAVKDVSNFGNYPDTSSTLVTSYVGGTVTYVLTDVEIAVKATK